VNLHCSCVQNFELFTRSEQEPKFNTRQKQRKGNRSPLSIASDVAKISLPDHSASRSGHGEAQLYLASETAPNRLAQRRAELGAWLDADTRIVTPSVWLDGDTDFMLGGLRFRLVYSGGAHAPDDLMMYVVDDRVLFAGDLLFAGRLPYVGSADTRGWLSAMDKMLRLEPAIVVPGHGPASTDVGRDLAMTRDYLVYLRQTMGRAAREFQPFDEAYPQTDWSRFADLPAFAAANRANAYGTYLRMEQEELENARGTTAR
jgi:glyoxylase-like metal-dependent hydrolase (beta-lactamase superfamily II)